MQKKIKEKLQSLGLTNKEFATFIGKSERTVERWVSINKLPTMAGIVLNNFSIFSDTHKSNKKTHSKDDSKPLEERKLKPGPSV